MCWQCENPQGSEQEYLALLRAIISDHGWAIQFVEDARRPFAYTVGLYGMGQPELLITGVSAETSARLLNSIAHQMADGDVELRPGTHIDYQSEFLFEVVEVEHPDVHLKCAVGLFGARIRAFQLVWADKRRRWPWDRGWNHPRSQPVLGRRHSPALPSHR